MRSRDWVVVVPVKPPSRGKSRLRTLPPRRREGLASAFALDTVAAALSCRSVGAVLAVTDDFRFADQLREAGCSVLPDGAAGDLNEVLVQAACEAVRRHPGAGVAALCADLPALRAADLEAALAAVPAARPGFVADTTGTGTTCYAAADLASFRPQFGPGSAVAHRSAGAVSLVETVTADLRSLRLDVDDATDLRAALELGVGEHTAAACSDRALGGVPPRR